MKKKQRCCFFQIIQKTKSGLDCYLVLGPSCLRQDWPPPPPFPGWPARSPYASSPAHRIHLIKKKIKFSWGLPNIWGNAQIFPHMWGGRYSHIWHCNCSILNFLTYIWGKFSFLFNQCRNVACWVQFQSYTNHGKLRDQCEASRRRNILN
jgi:hypothetical protein